MIISSETLDYDRDHQRMPLRVQCKMTHRSTATNPAGKAMLSAARTVPELEQTQPGSAVTKLTTHRHYDPEDTSTVSSGATQLCVLSICQRREQFLSKYMYSNSKYSNHQRVITDL